MANKAVAIIGLAVLVLLFVGLVIAPSIGGGDTYNSLNLKVEVYGTRHGERVTLPLAFIDTGGSEVDSLRCDASWNAQGDGIDLTTLIIQGEWVIEIVDYQGQVAGDVTPSGMDFQSTGDGAADDSTYFNLPLDMLLVGQPFSGYSQTQEMQYWSLKISWSISGSVSQTISDLPALTDTLDDYIMYNVFWLDGTFSLTGGIK